MSIKYYTHFVTNQHQARKPDTQREFSGVVEVLQTLPYKPDNAKANEKTIAAILARTLQIDAEDIHILQCARLH